MENVNENILHHKKEQKAKKDRTSYMCKIT